MNLKELRKWADDCVQRDLAERKKQFKSRRKPIRVARFRSSSGTGTYDLIKWHGKITCTCPGFQFRRRCKHVEAVA